MVLVAHPEKISLFPSGRDGSTWETMGGGTREAPAENSWWWEPLFFRQDDLRAPLWINNTVEDNICSYIYIYTNVHIASPHPYHSCTHFLWSIILSHTTKPAAQASGRSGVWRGLYVFRVIARKMGGFTGRQLVRWRERGSLLTWPMANLLNFWGFHF